MAETVRSNQLNDLPGAVKQILEARGIYAGDYEEFFSARPRLAYDPFLLANMEAGVDSLLRAVDAGKKIVIYGDYDVDGITSTSLMMKVIGSLTDNVSYYIPSRMDEGYGLHKDAIDRIGEDGGELIITVDCGSVSLEETAYAHSIGIDTIVTDHHNVSSVRAEGIIINPWLEEDNYPFKGLAGVGVAYKFAIAISRKRSIPKEIMAEILELVCVGTVADIMPVLDENRTIIKCGLRFIHLGCRNKGLRKLIDMSGFDYRTMRTSDISYGIAPKINAVGRLGDATLGVKLFLAETDAEAERYASELIETNSLRRTLQNEAYEKSLEVLDSPECASGDIKILEVNDGHEGVLGIVAGKIREEINRPVIIVSRNGDFYKGTGRSIETIDLFELLDAYHDIFLSFGGHSAACGFKIAADRLGELRAGLNGLVAEKYRADNTIFDIEYKFDAEIDASDIDLGLAEATALLEPCGKDNEVPVFVIRGVKPRNWRFLKNETKYAKFGIVSDEGAWTDCLLFHDAQKYYDIVEKGEPVDIYGSVEINRWRDSVKVQIIVDHILPTEGM